MTDDREIIHLYKVEGKEEYAFNLIVNKYSQRLYWLIRKMVSSHDETNDILQNTLLKAWNNLSGFREDSNLYTWLYRIATNETINHLRKEKLRRFISLADKEHFVSEKLESDHYFNGDDIKASLYKAIRMLPPKQMAVFNLRYFEEMKYEDIAQVLGGTVGSLKASYHHAYTKIQEYLEKNN